MVFRSSAMKTLFLEVLAKAKRKYSFRLENFCVMGNHFHFIIQPGPRESLSSIMHWIMGVSAMVWNRANRLTGHLWADRYSSKVLASLTQFLQVFQYVNENPVRAGLCLQPELWEFGGLWHRSHGITGVLDPVPDLSSWPPK